MLTMLPIRAGAANGDERVPRPDTRSAKASGRMIGSAKASRKAVREIRRRTGQNGKVTGIVREDDFGARWEVEVSINNGREFDVYVDRRGRIVKVIRNRRGGADDGGSGGDVSGSGSVSRDQASEIALAHIEKRYGVGARVTGVGAEDDFGAQWEVEVTVADGIEFDVYVDATGRVVNVIETGYDG